MHLLFYGRIDPALYQRWGSPKDKDFGGFGKFIFVPDECLFNPNAGGEVTPETKILYVASGKCDKIPFTDEKKSKFIYRQDGTVIFQIYPWSN